MSLGPQGRRPYPTPALTLMKNTPEVRSFNEPSLTNSTHQPHDVPLSYALHKTHFQHFPPCPAEELKHEGNKVSTVYLDCGSLHQNLKLKRDVRERGAVVRTVCAISSDVLV